jgi:para-aminobenzoate synthetase/4-amino-4-deoxychorismate lyase
LPRLVLDFPGLGHLELARPRRVLSAASPGEVRAVLRAVEAEARGGRWAAGFVAYEAAPAFDPALRVRAPGPGPLAWFSIHDRPAAPLRAAPGEARLEGLAPEMPRARHAAALATVRRALRDGVAYQVNLTLRLRGRFRGDPLGLYRRLRAAQGECLGACLLLGRRAIVSASPELFFTRLGSRVTVRPMKGTARRGRFPAEDDAAAAALAASPKERAGNLMVVDLLRSDLGRVARTGTVKATRLLEVERHPTVLQLTSTVEAGLRRGAGLDDLFAAAFPSGSVTGAPKSSATGLIAGLEESPRGPYCGAIGVVRPGGDATFSVAIRTVDLDLVRGTAAYGTGGGITWDSDPAAEWDEVLAKAEVLAAPAEPFRLLETLRCERGVLARRDLHLERLAASAAALGFAFDRRAVERALDARTREPARGARRLRLLLAPGGEVEVEAAPAPPPNAGPLPVALARAPVSRLDRSLFHKTTRRRVYEERRGERPDAFDVLLVNEEGELTEFTIGNLAVERGGELLTPPLDCGLLPGTLRRELLERGRLREAVLRPPDLRRARRIWLLNSLRGMVPVELR